MTASELDTQSGAPEAAGASRADDLGWGDGMKNCCVGCFILCVAGAVAILFALAQEESIKADTLARVRAMGPLCQALDAYTQKYGRSPASLEDLDRDLVSELPSFREAERQFLLYEGGQTREWKLTVWGGGERYERFSLDEPWFLTGDYDEDYPRARWRVVR